MSNRLTTYAEFWPYYLREHGKPATRWLHFAGTQLGVAAGVAAVVTQNPWLAPAALVLGYGPAWIGHFFVEKNRPATFKYPLWSLISDFRMIGLMWIGKLAPELAAARSGNPKEA